MNSKELIESDWGNKVAAGMDGRMAERPKQRLRFPLTGGSIVIHEDGSIGSVVTARDGDFCPDMRGWISIEIDDRRRR